MRIEAIAWTTSGMNSCGHPYSQGDACYVLFPVIGMQAYATTCADCGVDYVRAMQRLARLTPTDRRQVQFRAESAAHDRRGDGMRVAADAWRTVIEDLTPR